MEVIETLMFWTTPWKMSFAISYFEFAGKQQLSYCQNMHDLALQVIKSKWAQGQVTLM